MLATFLLVLLCLVSQNLAVPHSPYRHRSVGKRAIPSGWTSVGCIADGEQRALSAYTFSSDKLTQESCIAGCSAAGYSYAGMQYYSQCFCANSFTNGMGTPVDALQCSTACSGNANQMCGGPWRLSVFTSLPSGWSLARSCAVDTPSRILPSYSITLNNNSPKTCIRICELKGYTMAGVEYGDECRCGNSWNGGNPASAPDSECNKSCAGDDSQKCGGAWRIRVYSSGTASIDPTTTSSASPATTSGAASLPTGWKVAMACAVDTPLRVLSGELSTLSSNSPSACIKTCAAKGYTFSGVQVGSECHCGNGYNGATPDSAPSSDCNIPCSGDSSVSCGGSWRIQVYSSASTTTSSVTSSTSATPPTSSSTYVYSGTTVAPVATPAPPSSSSDKLVVAHFMVGNTYPYQQSDWLADIKLAASQGIDGFALNFGSDWWQSSRIADAYAAASTYGNTFKLFLSFDMTSLGCGGQGEAGTLRNYINTYANHPAQLIYRGRSLVSTFSGENCYFGMGSVDDGWNSVLRNGVPPVYFVLSFFVDPASFSRYSVFDGDFNWDGSWPRSSVSTNMDLDNQHLAGNGGKIFMAAASPWFYSHYSFKNWFYGGDEWLYPTRWEQLVTARDRVDIVEIISWNDYGESHYVGPIEGAQPNSEAWVNGFDHTAWLELGAVYSKVFKTGTWPTFTKDKIFLWTRPHPAGANALADGLGKPLGWDWTKDYLWALVFSTGPAAVTLTSGSNTKTFVISAGITKLKLESAAGSIRGTMTRDGKIILDVAPSGFTYTTSPSTYNYNAFVATSQ